MIEYKPRKKDSNLELIPKPDQIYIAEKIEASQNLDTMQHRLSSIDNNVDRLLLQVRKNERLERERRKAGSQESKAVK